MIDVTTFADTTRRELPGLTRATGRLRFLDGDAAPGFEGVLELEDGRHLGVLINSLSWPGPEASVVGSGWR